MLQYLEGNINLTREFAKKHSDKMDLIEPEATYLLWLDFNKLKFSDKDLGLFLIKKAKLGLNPGTMFGSGGEGFHRMNIACPRSTIVIALNQLEDALNSL
jgi:cystathionine beta-lyase